MAASKVAVPSLSEYQCHICTEIFMEPVTLPCKHTLCKTCLRSTIEKASLCCPFCRRRISSWTRLHTRKNTLVNVELWETIQNQYPEECRRRQAEAASDDDPQLEHRDDPLPEYGRRRRAGRREPQH